MKKGLEEVLPLVEMKTFITFILKFVRAFTL